MVDMDEREAELEAGRMPLLAHLAELRNRLLWSLGAILAGFLICYQFKYQIYGFLVHPLAVALKGQPGRHLIYTGLTEAFFTYVKVSFWAGFCLAFPVVARQVWKFVAPGLLSLSVRDAGLVRDGGGARLFCRHAARLAVLRQLRIAGRSRQPADRARPQGQRVSLPGHDPARRLRGRLPDAGPLDADGAGRARHLEGARRQAPLCDRRHVCDRRRPDPARRGQPDEPRPADDRLVRGVDLLLPPGRKGEGPARGRGGGRPRRQGQSRLDRLRGLSTPDGRDAAGPLYATAACMISARSGITRRNSIAALCGGA